MKELDRSLRRAGVMTIVAIAVAESGVAAPSCAVDLVDTV